MTCTLQIPGCRIEGETLVPLEYQFTQLGAEIGWIANLAATATAKITNADTDATILDDADTQATGAVVTLTDDGRCSLDVTDALATLLRAASAPEGQRYRLRYFATTSAGKKFKSPPILFTVKPDT
jgi:hypothetical protein